MSICWYCHWGWSKPVADIFKEYAAKIDALDSDYYTGENALKFGPGHIVWEDENWDCIDWCLNEIDTNPATYIMDNGMSVEILALVRESLVKLKELPQDVVEVEPDNYDGEHPELFPPPAGVEMIQL